MIPGEHILPCPQCGVPVDTSEPDRWKFVPIEDWGWSRLSAYGYRVVCQSCKTWSSFEKVHSILKCRDERERELVGEEMREGNTRIMEVWIRFKQ